MAIINPTDHKGYDEQDNFQGGNNLRTGSYVVAITRLQRQFVGQKQTPKLGLGMMVLEAFDSENEDLVGTYHQPSRIGIWADFEKPGNARRLAWLARACGCKKGIDTDNDAAMVKALTGIPFMLTVAVEVNERNGKTYNDIDITETKDVTPDRRKALIKDPELSKALGAPGERMEDPYVSGQNNRRGGFSGGSGGGGGGNGQAASPPTDEPGYIADDPLFG